MTPDQATLFDPVPAGAARHHDPVTSLDAARAQRGGIEQAIREVFDRFHIGNLTDDELCAELNWANPPTVKTARSRLSRQGLLADSGVRRASDCGHSMICWARVRP